MWYGIYYIPSRSESIYHTLSTLTGYDIRSEQFTSSESLSINIKKRWQNRTRQYGAHLTISDTIFYASGPNTEKNLIKHVVDTIDSKRISQFPISIEGISIQNLIGSILHLDVASNTQLQNLHEAIVPIQSTAKSSSYLTRMRSDLNFRKSLSEKSIQKILTYKSHHILDDYAPHITLLNPVETKYTTKVAREILNILSLPLCLTISSLCLVGRSPREHKLRILYEHPLPK